MPDELVNVRYMVDDVERAIAFYTAHFGFSCASAPPPRSPTSTGPPAAAAERPRELGRAADARRAHPEPGGWNRIHLIVEDLAGEVERLRAAGLDVPQRHRHRPGRPADPPRRPRRQPDRAVPARRHIVGESQAGGRAASGLGVIAREWGRSAASGSVARRPTSRCCENCASSAAAG